MGNPNEHLFAAWMADLLREPATQEAQAFVDKITELTLEYEAEHHPRKRERGEDLLGRFKQGIGALLADLVHHSSNVEAHGFMYRSKTRGKFSDTLCSSRLFDHLIGKLWLEMGLIETHEGYQVWGEWGGVRYKDHTKAGRYRATSSLLQISSSHGLTSNNIREHFKKRHGAGQTVVVKGYDLSERKQKPISAPKSPKLDAAAKTVSDINAFVDGHEFSLTDKPQFHRVFNNGDRKDFDYNQGGRLICISKPNYQDLPSDERRKILIDGEAVCEIDVRTSQLSIFYADNEEPFDPERDHYGVPDIERDVVKRIVVVSLGQGKMPSRWPQGLKADYRKKTGKELAKRYALREVAGAVLDKHPILERMDPENPPWPRLQYLESEAIIGAMVDLKDRDIVALPVHDSLIVKKSEIDRMRPV